MRPPFRTPALVLAIALVPYHAQAQTTKPQVKAKVAEKLKKAASAPSPASPAKRLDLNKATAEEMVEILPGVGEVTAKKIVDGRKAAPYATVDDLARVGVPSRTIEGIRSLVTVSAPAPAAGATAGVAAEKGMTKKAVPAPAAPPLGHAAKVNLNTATSRELQTLPGIGPAFAKQIVGLRPIKALSDLEKIKGLSSDKVEELDEHVVILAAAPAAPAAPAAAGKATAKLKAKAVGKEAAAPAAELKPGQKINLNRASRDELQLLPGIGPVKSQAIIDARPFKTAADVMKVRGIKQGSFARIEPHVTVD